MEPLMYTEKRSKGNVILCGLTLGLMVLHFGLFDASPMNPIGIKYVQELYIAICLGFAAFLIAGSPKGRKAEYNALLSFCLFMTFMFVVMPAVFSMLYYGQPFQYGLIEERRVLMCFSAFWLLFAAHRMSAAQFERLILSTAMVAVVLSWLAFKEITPELRDLDGSHDQSRPGRASIGAEALIIGFCMCVYYWHTGKSMIDGSKRGGMIYIGLAVLFFMTLVFVTQTRQLLLVCLVFSILTLKLRFVKFGVVGVLVALPFYLNPELLLHLGVSLDFYMQAVEEGVQDNVRENTVGQILKHLDTNMWLPSGSLSLMWNGGFKPHFGDYFFLSDVGIVGTLFRFGFLSAVVIPMGLYAYWVTAKRLSRDMHFTVAMFLSFLIIWPLQGMFEYLQTVTATLFVFQALKTWHRKAVPQAVHHANYSQRLV